MWEGQGYCNINGDAELQKTSKNVAIVIKPKKASLVKAQAKKKGQLNLKWKRDSKASGYEISYTVNGKKHTKLIKKNATVTLTVKNLKSKASCSVKIRAYTMVDGERVYGAYSSQKKLKLK